ncbi:histidine kinase [Natronoarchaeum rubrum]|uniref:histidine kinase n=1 Tax=Natronoarchaeum rubrum TaxID=755311 RepID=UPI0021119D0C|nr:histidine kinase [Natronoarchaeum rubrum]
MSSRTGEPTEVVGGEEIEVSNARTWAGGAVGGLFGGVVMGVLMTVLMPGAVEVAIPAMYGLEGVSAGWGVHLLHSVLFGLVFAAIVMRPGIERYVPTSRAVVGAGALFGAALWLVAAGLAMPIWLSAVGFAGAPPLPNLAIPSLIAHLAYGLVLGVGVVALRR